MPLPLSAGDMTRVRRLEKVTKIVPYGPAFAYNTSLPNTNPTSTFVLACIDPRFAYALEEYLNETYAKRGQSYDLFILAGASMGGNLTGNSASAPPGNTVPTCAIVSASNNWRTTLTEHIQVAISLHNVTNLVIIDHLNCGAYVNCNGATGGPNGDQDVSLHTAQFTTLNAYIQAATFKANTTNAPTLGSVIFGNATFYYFDGVSASLSTTLRDFNSNQVRIGDKGSNSGAKVLVLGCIDPRYSAILTSFLTQYKQLQFVYDLFILAGASIGANQSYRTGAFPTVRANDPSTTPYPNNQLANNGAGFGTLGITWGPTFFDHLAVARLLHGVTEVWIFDHLDCGAYKAIKSIATDLDPTIHTTEILALEGLINTFTTTVDPLNATPYSLTVRGFVIDTAGEINSVLNQPSTGIGVRFGSSRIRNPASFNTDALAFNRASYINQVQPLDMSNEPGNSVGKSLQTVTTACGCITELNFPVLKRTL
jgi:carbonic anhydrase